MVPQKLHFQPIIKGYRRTMYQPREHEYPEPSGTAVSELAELLERLRQPSAGPNQFMADLLAAQCLLGQAEAGAILRGGQNNDVGSCPLPKSQQGGSCS